MAIDLQSSFATIVHTAPARARLESTFATVVHTAPARARLESTFATVVHGPPPPPPPPPPQFTRTSRLRMLVEGVQPPPAPYVNQARARTKYLDRRIGYGSGDWQFDALLAESGSLSSGGTLSIDLLTNADVFGVPLALADVALVQIENVSGTGTLVVRAAAANGWTNLLGTAADLQIAPGGSILLTSMTAGSLLVASGNSAIEVEASGGDLEYLISVWGRR